MPARLTTQEFITRARAKHGDKYDYSRVRYQTAKLNVEIPNDHLAGRGCDDCGRERTADSSRFSKEEFIAKAEQVHGKGTYDYSRVKYVNSQTHVEIICPKHGPFLTTPNNHLRERGCPGCAETGFDQTKPASLYYLRIEAGKEPLYKIDVTNREVEVRFSRELEKVSVIATWEYPFGSEALEKEREVLRTFKDHLYEGQPVLLSGNSEIFDFDVLGLDVHS